MATPAVSVVMATYNRCDVLAHAIASVVAQTITDWELLVVGDACTDGTEAVVASFDDARIRYFNRRENHGEQSVPNNDGVAMARGRTIAFLNHDDLWYPDHLQIGLATLERSGADLAYALRAVVLPDRTVDLRGTGAVRRGLLVDGVPASTWICRRALAERIGPWRSAFELRMAPSQDWLMRALNDGAELVCTDSITVVMVPSGMRKGSYLATDPADTHTALELVGHDRRAALRHAPARRDLGARGVLRRIVRHLLEALFILCRYHPYVIKSALLAGPRRGGYIRMLRRTRGLSPNPQRAQHG